MINTDWALDVLPSKLILRLKLTVTGRQGDERVQAAVLCHHSDEDGPLIGYVSWGISSFRPKELSIMTSSTYSRWPEFLRTVTEDWSSSWLSSVDKLYELDPHYRRSPGKLDELEPSHVLVLQHLARLHGMVLVAWSARRNANEGALLRTMEHRLATVIANANADRMKLVTELELTHRL